MEEIINEKKQAINEFLNRWKQLENRSQNDYQNLVKEAMSLIIATPATSDESIFAPIYKKMAEACFHSANLHDAKLYITKADDLAPNDISISLTYAKIYLTCYEKNKHEILTLTLALEKCDKIINQTGVDLEHLIKAYQIRRDIYKAQGHDKFADTDNHKVFELIREKTIKDQSDNNQNDTTKEFSYKIG